LIKILFIGSFLIHHGSKDVCETISEKISQDNFKCKLVSRKQNKILRLLDILTSVLFFSGKIIHINVFSGPAFQISEYASLLAKLRGKKLLLSLHGGILPEFSERNASRIAKVFNRADKILTPSLYLKAFFEKQGYQIDYLPNSVDLAKFPYGRNQVKPSSILWVRAFTQIYNPELAIKAFLEVKKKIPEATLTMVGPDKGILNESKELIHKLGLEDSITITGPVKNEELYTYFQSHSVFINTTSYESFGVAVLEAASCGIPIVSTKVGEIPYLWEHEKNILLTLDFEPVNFANEILKLINNQDMSSNLSREARIKAESFTWENIKPYWIKVLKD